MLPTVHLCACLITCVAFLTPRLEFFGLVFDFVFEADYPISFMAWLFAWNNPSFILLQTVLGTLWWYLLSRAAEALLVRFSREKATLT